ncbi:alpha/beta hydrolase family protein [Lysinibacter cavernae]|uniref:Alpha-beta hydrolase superfamily lysophospholipase n=1 Tax=Lysinibacter cavernae TaxID=1640652 RepID=A0A7X5TS84_9MICO|nr:alpha/beta fold hydrolase [Lysinibacter cavernae]NIH52675.1 alpha-beta hydrolase superfamily lysophospholipase [Lysinibacter cavernae]
MTKQRRTSGIDAQALVVAAGGLAAGVGAIMVGSGLVALRFARAVVSRPTSSIYDIPIVASDIIAETVTLGVHPDCVLPGHYTLISDNGDSICRIGEIIERTDTRVTRQLITVDSGSPRPGTRGRISGWYYLNPSELGYPCQDVNIETELGPAPAWRIDAKKASPRWAIHVHGRGVQRPEAIRGVPPFREAGYTNLVVSYRNDGDAPDAPGKQYSLGDTEWRDVDSAISYARANGATSIVLFGWSMGGATVLQTLLRSQQASVIRGLVLDSPVIDWYESLRVLAAEKHLPPTIQNWAFDLLSTGLFRATQPAAINLRALNMVERADELTVPILLMHSDDDGFITSAPSRALAQRRQDIVTFVPFRVARHTKLWNFDRNGWASSIRSWITSTGINT